MYESYQHLKFERRGRILTVVMNRPEVKNAANVRMHNELSRVFRDVAADPEAGVIVLTGAGDAFAAGLLIARAEGVGWKAAVAAAHRTAADAIRRASAAATD